MQLIIVEPLFISNFILPHPYFILIEIIPNLLFIFSVLFFKLEISAHEKSVAIFGVGDASSFSANFCDAMGELYDCFEEAGAKFYGATATSEIEFDESKAVVELVLYVNQ